MKFDFVTIGTATRDTFAEINDSVEVVDQTKFPKKIFPTGKAQCFPLGGKMEIKSENYIGGGAANAAVTFSRQGFKTAAFLEVGKDNDGEEIISVLKKEKVNVISKKTAKKTASSIILLNKSGERTILVDRGDPENLSSDNLPESKWAYITPGNIPTSKMSKIFSVLSKRKTLIAFNPSRNYISLGMVKLKPFLSKCKVVLLNREEGSYLTGIDFSKEKEIFERLDEIIDGIIVMTDGSKGAIISDGNHIYRIGGYHEKQVVDRTGAGDAFGSGFVVGLARKLEKCDALYKKRGLKFFNEDSYSCDIEPAISYAMKIGSANATSVIESVGAETGILKKGDFEKDSRWKKISIFSTKI